LSVTIEKARFLAVILILGLLSAKGTFGQAPAPHPPAPTATHTGSKPAVSATTLSEARKNSIMKYVRGRFGVPDAVKLTFADVKPSPVSPAYFDAVMMVDDGKNPPHPQELLISRDGRFLLVVTVAVIDIQRDTPEEMAKRIQEVFKTPPEIKMSVGPFKPSASLDFKQATLTIDNGKSKQDRTVLLARDGKHIVVSDLYNMTLDPRQHALRNISLHDEPSVGPANAPVTIVEYADLQCPTCARMHEFLETKVIPRYGNKLRVVFKEFPLPMHDWSFTAAIADQCAYEINPSTYVPLRTMIFRNQQLINITNLRETLLSYGEQAGLDRVQLAGCLDSKASLPRIQRDQEEAKRLDVNSTPTLFINGKMMVGLPSEDEYYQAIDDALKGK
jgi:protein-disulfide isomerase